MDGLMGGWMGGWMDGWNDRWEGEGPWGGGRRARRSVREGEPAGGSPPSSSHPHRIAHLAKFAGKTINCYSG
jgi:hypothetical protein